jgi:hypothetical protein
MAHGPLRVMDTQIFNLNLSVHATSAYIAICSLASDGLPPTLKNVEARWMAEPELLDEALRELKAWLVIDAVFTREGERLIVPNPASLWRPPGYPAEP